jgi:hypothetical protein
VTHTPPNPGALEFNFQEGAYTPPEGSEVLFFFVQYKEGEGSTSGEGHVLGELVLLDGTSPRGVALGGSHASADNGLRPSEGVSHGDSNASASTGLLLSWGMGHGRSNARADTPRYVAGLSRGAGFARAINPMLVAQGRAVGVGFARAHAPCSRPGSTTGVSFALAYAPTQRAGLALGFSEARGFSGHAPAVGSATGVGRARAFPRRINSYFASQEQVFIRLTP